MTVTTMTTSRLAAVLAVVCLIGAGPANAVQGGSEAFCLVQFGTGPIVQTDQGPYEVDALTNTEKLEICASTEADGDDESSGDDE